MAEPFVGIDLGTTNSAVATVEQGHPVLIPSRHGGSLTPSVIYVSESGQRLVGEAARERAETDWTNAAYAVKRLIGRTGSSEIVQQARRRMPYVILGGVNDEVRIRIGGKVFALPELSAMILTELRLDAEAHFGQPVRNAVITVPANFSDGQRQATKEAADIAGLNMLRLVNEPTAAALAYGFGRDFKGKLVVFDLGGGTFDVSLLEIGQGVFEVLATGGDTFLGGEDFDLRIADWLVAQLPQERQPGPLEWHDVLQRLKVVAEEAKIRLSTAMECEIKVSAIRHTAQGEAVDLDTVLTREFLEILAKPFAERCTAICEKVIADAGVAKADIQAVLLAGGMTRMPLIRRVVSESFEKDPVAGMNPDEVVAIGAAIESAGLTHQTTKALLLDVIPNSLGIEVVGGYARRLIAKHTKTPATAKEIFHTSHDGQERARIVVLQGEATRAEENQVLGDLILEGLRPSRRGEVAIEVRYEVGVNGTLDVNAKDLGTGQEMRARIEAKGLLSPEEHARLVAREEEYLADARKKDALDRVDRHRRLIMEAEQLFPVVYAVAAEFPEAAGAVQKAAGLWSEAKRIDEMGDSPALAASVRTMEQLVQSLKEIARLRK
jgi:molecular chaperone DnaK